MKKILILATAASALATSPAMAEDDASFTGPRIGLEGGWARVAGDGHKGSDGFSYGALLGYDVGSGAVRFGPEVKFGDSTQKHCKPYPAGGSADAHICRRSDRDLYVGLRLGVVAAPNLLVFGTGGYTNARFSDHYRDITVGPRRDYHIGRDVGGYRFGGGLEYAVTPNIYVSGTYHYSGWKHKDWDHHVHQNQVLAGVGYRF